MSNQKNDRQNKMHDTSEITESYVTSSSDVDIQKVFNKPVNHAYNSTIPNRYHQENLIYGVVLGDLIGVTDDGGDQQIYVNYPGNPYTIPMLAMTTVKLNSTDAGKSVVLSFDQGNPLRPIITGLLQNAEPKVEELAIDIKDELKAQNLKANIDGELVTLSADKEIVLKCGKSSITLTKAGKIIIRGEYLLSRSNGVNKIKGGSVQIN